VAITPPGSRSPTYGAPARAKELGLEGEVMPSFGRRIQSLYPERGRASRRRPVTPVVGLPVPRYQ
jgi:hypothetical protein